MIEFFKEYIKIIKYIACGLVFALGFYYILLNLFHASAINKTVYLSNNNQNLIEYRNIVNEIKTNLDGYQYSKIEREYDIVSMEKYYYKVKYCYDLLTDEGSFYRLELGSYLKPFDIYTLNSSFNNRLVNDCWITGIATLTDSVITKGTLSKLILMQNKTVSLLSFNSNYLGSELLDNSSYYYNTAITNATIRNNLVSEYGMLEKNNLTIAKLVLQLAEYANKGEYK